MRENSGCSREANYVRIAGNNECVQWFGSVWGAQNSWTRLANINSLTCRRRRVKCDEGRPRCGNCSRSNRGCEYSQPPASCSSSTRSPESHPPDTSAISSVHASKDHPIDPALSSAAPVTTVPSNEHSTLGTDPPPVVEDIQVELQSNEPDVLLGSISDFGLSPFDHAAIPSPGTGPFDWFDLLAQDAINNIQRQGLGGSGPGWNFDESFLSRRQSPVPISRREPQAHLDLEGQNGEQGGISESSLTEPWNTSTRITLHSEELVYFQHYVSAVGPILDLFDPTKHFTNIVPHLAVHNVGLLKSLLAVAARHMSLHSGTNDQNEVQTPGSSLSRRATDTKTTQMATQYYYETLQYLSQTLLYPSYTRSFEILATSIMISTYEMFDTNGSTNNGDWERHLRGAFWILRSQDNDGESTDGLRQAVWWAWVRQDIWAAFREGRRTLTIWRPKKRLVDLNGDELAKRIIYIAAKCVEFAATEKEEDISKRIAQGNKLLHALENWRCILPPSYQAISTAPSPASPSMSSSSHLNNLFVPKWIHPPSYAAAVQTYHFARIVVLLNQPSLGGLNAYRNRQKMLDESVEEICGISMVEQGKELPSAFVNLQALYAAGLCVQTPEKQNAILYILENALEVSKFPLKTLMNDLLNVWRECA